MKSIYPVLVFFIFFSCKKESAESEAVSAIKMNITKEWKLYSMITIKPSYSGLYNDCLKDYTTFVFEKTGTFSYIQQNNAACG